MTDHNPLHIAIVGLPKSGTTFLYTKIRNAVQEWGDPVCLHEPEGFAVPAGVDADGRWLVTKVHANGDRDWNRGSFDKVILLIRDPRDIMVSRLLYFAGYHCMWNKDRHRLAEQIRLLKRKESMPGAISMMQLHEELTDSCEKDVYNHYRQWFERMCELADGHPSWHNVTYEDLIAGQVSALEEHLGLRLSEPIDVNPEFQRVVRTKGSGDWRHWFTASDIDKFSAFCRPYMERFGYDAGDWALSSPQRISSKHGSEYVRRLIAERRANEGWRTGWYGRLRSFCADRLNRELT